MIELVEITQKRQINSIMSSGLDADLGTAFSDTICDYFTPRDDVDDLWIMYILYANKKPAGVCALYNNKVGKRDELWVGWFGIYPKNRSKGYGSRMMNMLKKKASSLGVERLLLYCNTDRTTFYEANQFSTITDKRTINRFIRECEGKEEFTKKHWVGSVMSHNLKGISK